MDAPRPQPVFRAFVTEEGELRFRELPRWRGTLARLRGKDVMVRIEREGHTRSLSANAYLWGVVYATAAEWCGHDAEELHEVFKRMFLPKREATLPTGEVVDLPPSTRDLDTEAFSVYVNKVIRWLAESGVSVPTASEVA